MNEICVGTIQKENNQNEYKINIDSKQGILYSDGYIHDLSWLIPGESFVYTSGDGFLNIASITNSFEINKTNLLFHDKLCSDTIRQISIDDFSSRIAFGGYDKKLNIFNFDDGRSSISSNTDGKISYNVSGNIGSINWHPTEPIHLSYTTDEGMWVLADLRDKNIESCLIPRRIHLDLREHIFGSVS